MTQEQIAEGKRIVEELFRQDAWVYRPRPSNGAQSRLT